MRALVVVVVVVMLVLGCGGTEPVLPDTAQSGSRLKLSWLEHADGLRTWAQGPNGGPHLFDTKLQLPCKLRRWADGVTRCTPHLGGVWYEDGACTKPVLPNHDTPFHAELDDDLRPRAPLFVRSDRIKPLPEAFALDTTTGNCVGFTSPSLFVAEVESSGRPSQLVSIELAHSDDAPIAVEVARSDDGLTVPVGLYDRELEAQCTFEGGSAPEGRCVPPEVRNAEHYTDAACQRPVLVGFPRVYYAALRTTPCPRYFEVGDELPPQPLFQQYQECRDTGTPIEQSTYRLTEVEVQPLVRTIEPGTTRARLIYVAHGNARYRLPDRFFDDALQTECMMDTTGTCEPPFAEWKTKLFSDAACTAPLPDLAAGLPEVATCGREPVPVVTRAPTGLRLLGARHTGDVYQLLDIGCSPLPLPMFELGEHAPAVLSAQVVRDP